MKERFKKTLKNFFTTPPGLIVMSFIIAQFNKIENIYLSWRHDEKVIRLVNKINRETEILVTNNEAFQIYALASSLAKLDGDFAEVGVYKGGTAKLICEAIDGRVVHLFDTFEGLPQKSYVDEVFQPGQFAASLEETKRFLSGYKNVRFYKGIFPTTASAVADKTFVFVHLDVDFYKSTFDSLAFFYPRMIKGGIILSHDYSTLSGVKKAFDEFFADKEEIVISLSTTQCLVTKL